ncbi:Flagellar hook-associated protein FlgL [Euzebya pacifica]|uniref:Flagellar hook-associated protein FlgL n=1 Tax=Euzebya pacifica TaxID=1608957 RepID=A0A346XUJ9_9ACTN|nr:flagellar hook-associated protein FlgL [Euzebya pacifica]AXV05896.1 Flagellar hook-associated protein FlgL [Euzebya pacifica]
MTRITQGMVARSSLANLQKSLGRTQRLQEQLSTGRQLNRPSDSPTGLVTAMQTRSSLARREQHLRNADNAVGWLNTADAALQGSSNMLRRVRDLTVQGGNSTLDPVSRENMAQEIEAIRAGLTEIANSRYAGRLLFAGNADVPAAFDAAGNFQGDTGQVERTLADGQQIAVNVSGIEVFGSGAGSVFDVLTQIADDLRNNPEDVVANNLDNLDTRVDTVLTALGDIGARTNRIENMRERATSDEINLKTRLSEAEDVDLPETIMELQLQEVAYQAALNATSRVIQPSLLDFLR